MAEEKDPFDLIEDAMSQDPRTAVVGMNIGGSFVLDSTRVYVWFETIEKMIEYITEVEPKSRELDDDFIAEQRAKLEPLMNQIRESGVTEDLREEVNNIISTDWVIDWWGSLESLTNGETEFALDVVQGFYEEESRTKVETEDLDAFIESLSL